MNVIPRYTEYRATEDGRIISTKRTPNTICKQTSHSPESPPRVQIREDGTAGNRFVPVARLVAAAYYGDHGDEVAVMNLDGDLRNCVAANLAWVDALDPASWIVDTAPVPGYPGYFAHATGAIFSARRGGVVRELKLITTSGGDDLSVVMFDESGWERLVRVGAAVCAAFHGDANGQVIYLDGDRKNAASINLAWANESEDLRSLPPGPRPIPGFPGYYVGEDATVYTTVALSAKSGSVFRLTQSLDFADYWCVTLRQDGLQRRKRVHVLVAMAFHGIKTHAALVARHLDDDRDNNHYSNIAWGTHEENMLDRDRNGNTARGPRLQALTDKDVIAIRRRCDAGEKPGRVGKDYRMRAEVIANIAARRTFTDIEERT